ncbi:MAG: hypothetical protein ACLVKO_05390 [Dysgonomonas sp.]
MKKYILGSLLTAILTLSCSSVKFITVNVEKPASLTIPSSVRNIVIVNNTGVQPADIGHFTLKGIDDEEKVEVSSDSLNIILTQALAQFMDEESFF